MTIQEKIALKNENEVRLYKEGVFWVAYEYDAYLISQIKKLKPTKKFVKAVQQEVVSVGFPTTALDQLLPYFNLLERKEVLIVLESKEPIDQSAFEQWKVSIETKEKSTTGVNTYQTSLPNFSHSSVIEKISSFKLHLATPMDCMRFVEELQKEAG